MSLYETIDRDFKSALKSRDELRLAVMRMLRTGLKNREVELLRKLEDPEILSLISYQAKQRRDSIEQFTRGDRDDLVQREKAELAVLEGYLPSQMDPEAIESAVADLIRELEADSMKDMGRVMKTMMSRFAGQVDGKIVSDVVKKQLASL